MNEVNPNLEALHTFFLQINDLATLEKCHGLNPTLLQDNDFMKVWIQGHSINIPVSLENEICDIYIYIEN
jgi:hypothetical protein